MEHFTPMKMKISGIILGHLLALKPKYKEMGQQIKEHVNTKCSYGTPIDVDVVTPHSWCYYDGVLFTTVREDWERAVKQGGCYVDLWTSAMETDNICIAVGSFLIKLRYETEILQPFMHDPNKHAINRIHNAVVEKYHQLNGTFFSEDETNLTLPVV